jgi:anti-anti-sigma factor
MQISTRTSNDIHIVAISGSLDSSTSPEGQKSLDAVLASAKKIVLDFSQLDYISSAGLRVLLGAAKKLRASGGTLGMFGLNQSVREVFEISGFASILPIYQSEAEALGAIAS